MKADVCIVGAGIAGASLAAEVAPHASVVMLEAESQPGYHSTGRSAAFWSESYGGPVVQPLTTASGPVLAAGGFLNRRGAIHLADADGRVALRALEAEFAGTAPVLERMDRIALDAVLPGLRAGWDDGIMEASTADIDVAALHADCLRRAQRAGATVLCDAPLVSAERAGGGWRIVAGTHRIAADILVNAGGAWADEVAVRAGARPIGIRPYRRTMAQIRLATPLLGDMPLVLDAVGRFYLKVLPDGRLWLSPHDETACDAGDAAAEEIDVATAIARMETAFDWQVARVEHSWAGLRSFSPDRVPVYGFAEPGFFWCAGQGGFGIQTAPAAARMAAGVLLSRPTGDVDPAPFGAGRFSS